MNNPHKEKKVRYCYGGKEKQMKVMGRCNLKKSILYIHKSGKMKLINLYHEYTLIIKRDLSKYFNSLLQKHIWGKQKEGQNQYFKCLLIYKNYIYAVYTNIQIYLYILSYILHIIIHAYICLYLY